MAGINLTKGGNASIGSIQKFMVGMGWDPNKTDSGQQFDLDASAFMLNAKGQLLTDSHFVYYNNVKSPEGCLEHAGDNTTGEGDGDDEKIQVDLSKLPAGCEKITFVVTIHDAENRRQNFGQVSKAHVRIFNPISNEEILKYDLGEDFSVETAIEFGELYCKDGAWKFKAIGVGFAGGLQKFVDLYKNN
jgi:tellurium resistance protein TerD